MVKFIKVSSTAPVVDYLSKVISEHLSKGQKVFWLLAGGSAIGIAVAVSKELAEESLENLTVTLTDERYGPVGHSDSNWLQLEMAGLKLPGAKLLPVLKNNSVEATTKTFEEVLSNNLTGADYKIGLFGIGPDGHTSGILPHSPGVDSPSLAVNYPAPDYGQRITTTAAFIEKLDEAVVYAAGEPKKLALQNLQKDLNPADQPAQILKKLDRFILFNDYIGDSL